MRLYCSVSGTYPDGKSRVLKGAYVVGGNNLVMQPDSGGVMLSEIIFKDDGSLMFSLLGDKVKLTFKRE